MRDRPPGTAFTAVVTGDITPDPGYLEELRAAFDIFDKNKDGTISITELEEVLKNMGEKPTKDDMKRMMANVDKDGDKNISFDEFVTLMASAKTSSEDELRQAFRVFDADGNGTIDKPELKRVMEMVGEAVTKEQLDAMFKLADVNGDGEISFDEFCTMMKSDLR